MTVWISRKDGNRRLTLLFSDKDWELPCRVGQKKNHKIWKYIGWKVKMRFFRTALVTSKFSDSLDQCWRGCASWKSAHTYFGTACAKLSGYWHKKKKKKKVPLTIILLFERNITRRYSIEDNNQTLLMRVVRLIAKKTKARIFSVFMD